MSRCVCVYVCNLKCQVNNFGNIFFFKICKGYCEILDLTQTDGEASANNRKAKLIFFYEWVIAGTWQGRYNEKYLACIHILYVLIGSLPMHGKVDKIRDISS